MTVDFFPCKITISFLISVGTLHHFSLMLTKASGNVPNVFPGPCCLIVSEVSIKILISLYFQTCAQVFGCFSVFFFSTFEVILFDCSRFGCFFLNMLFCKESYLNITQNTSYNNLQVLKKRKYRRHSGYIFIFLTPCIKICG